MSVKADLEGSCGSSKCAGRVRAGWAGKRDVGKVWWWEWGR